MLLVCVLLVLFAHYLSLSFFHFLNILSLKPGAHQRHNYITKRSPKRKNCLVWLFAINRITIPRIYSCSELVCAIVDLGIVGLSVMCAHCGHNLFIYLCKT